MNFAIPLRIFQVISVMLRLNILLLQEETFDFKSTTNDDARLDINANGPC